MSHESQDLVARIWTMLGHNLDALRVTRDSRLTTADRVRP